MTSPAFRDLPLSPHLALRCAWDVFGQDDASGTLNFLTPETVMEALASVRSGERVSLSLPITQPDPGLFWRSPPTHVISQIDRNTFDDRLDGLFLQGSTHWDGFLHVSGREDGFYGGFRGDPIAADSALGISSWKTGIVGRGVLVDVAAHLKAAGRPIDPCNAHEVTVSDLRATLAHQGTDLRPGSILCLRTGWTGHFTTLTPAGRRAIANRGHFPGLRADEAMAEFLWDSRVAAVAADNPAVEVAPGTPATGSLHRRSLVMTGLPFGELFDLDALASRCHSNARWDFLFVSVPLNLPGGVGSPANAVAIL